LQRSERSHKEALKKLEVIEMKYKIDLSQFIGRIVPQIGSQRCKSNEVEKSSNIIQIEM